MSPRKDPDGHGGPETVEELLDGMPDQDVAHAIREMRKRTDRANEELRTKGELSPETIDLLNQPLSPRNTTEGEAASAENAAGANAERVEKMFDK